MEWGFIKHRTRGGQSGTRSRRAGFSLIEIAVVMALLLIAIGGLSGAVISSIRLSEVNEQTAIADEAARRMLAEMSGVQFDQIFATFNADPNDDVFGPGLGEGPNFAVRGLTPRHDDPDGFVGEIQFPTVPFNGGLGIDENTDDISLGMPRDLTGDDDTDDVIQGGYLVLPVKVRLEWTVTRSTQQTGSSPSPRTTRQPAATLRSTNRKRHRLSPRCETRSLRASTTTTG